MNSVAGGGSFLTLPSLIFAGVAPVSANATSSVALWPGSVAGAIAYREDLSKSGRPFVELSVVSGVGGLLGALILLRTSNATFASVLPYLMLTATLVFTFSRHLTTRFEQSSAAPKRVWVVLLQFAISIYGGYFGGGMGLMMLAGFAMMGMTNIHAMNALKTALAALINLVAIVSFIAAGAVAWRPGIVMVAAAILGGYFGASAARRVAPERARRFVLAVAWSMTGVFFWRAYR